MNYNFPLNIMLVNYYSNFAAQIVYYEYIFNYYRK